MNQLAPRKLERARLDAAADPRALLPLLTVAALVGFSKSKIYALIQRDEFPQPVKLGKMARWRAAEIQQWLREQGGSEAGLAAPLRVLDPESGHVESLAKAVVRLAGQVKALVTQAESQSAQIDALLNALGGRAQAPIAWPKSPIIEVRESETDMRDVAAALAARSQADRINGLRRTPAVSTAGPKPYLGDPHSRVMAHLRDHMGIPTMEIVPYPYQVDALSKILSVLHEPTEAQWRAMERWFWRTAVSGFGGWYGGMKAFANAAAAAFAEGQEFDLDAPMTSPGPSLWFTASFRRVNATAKTLALILIRARPKDFMSGEDIDTSGAFVLWKSKDYAPFFPRSFLNAKGVPSRKTMALANIICLTDRSYQLIAYERPSRFLARLLDEHGDNARQWLASNLIDDAAIDAALIDDYDGFLAARAATIDEHMRKLAGWD